MMYFTEEVILYHGRSSPFKGMIQKPTRSAEIENSMCGDILRVDIKIDQSKIADIVFSGEGCLISQAAASLLVGKAKKVKHIDKIKKFDENTVLKLLGIQLTISRTRCALLSLEVLKKALKD